MQCNADQFFSLLKNTAMPELKLPSDSLSTLNKMKKTRTVKKKDGLCSQLACQVMTFVSKLLTKKHNLFKFVYMF